MPPLFGPPLERSARGIHFRPATSRREFPRAAGQEPRQVFASLGERRSALPGHPTPRQYAEQFKLENRERLSA